MKLNFHIILSLLSAVFLWSSVASEAFAQQEEKPLDIYQQAEKEADRLQRILNLDDWQLFYVDSTLKHDYTALMADYEELRKAKVTNSAMYQAVQDKWMEQIDMTYRSLFNDEQWAAYLKSGAKKQQKARARRRSN